jgi:hypothetical protein
MYTRGSLGVDVPLRVFRAILSTEISMYAIAQKEGNGLDKAVEDCKYRMRRYGVTPNLLVVPPQLSLYMALAPDEKIKYSEGGPQALAHFEAGALGFEARSFRGCGVVTSDPFDVADDHEAVQMLQRFSQVGEFYVMSKPHGTRDNQQGFMDVLIYDEESDRHVKIDYEDALKATGLFDWNLGSATIRGTFKAELVRLKTAAPADIPAIQTALNGLLGDGKEHVNVAIKMGTAGKTLGEWMHDALELMEANNSGKGSKVVTDAPIVIARPFIEHAMLSAVLAVAGADTGATIFGPSDMQISANTSVKTIEGYDAHPRTHISTPFPRRH